MKWVILCYVYFLNKSIFSLHMDMKFRSVLFFTVLNKNSYAPNQSIESLKQNVLKKINLEFQKSAI